MKLHAGPNAIRSVLSVAGLTVLSCALAQGTTAAAAEPGASPTPDTAAKPWCAPEVTELSDHVCFFDGGTRPGGRRTLIVYLHGSLVSTPGFQYVQQRMMRRVAKQYAFTVLIPTSPRTDTGYWWPSGAALKAQEPGILAGIARARTDLEARLGERFDETFVVGFSSGAYYASSLAVRSALDVDGYIVLAGGSSWMRPESAGAKRAPVFVGVSASDGQTAEHSRSFAGTLAALRWPYRVEERNVGHLVDEVFLVHGIAFLRSRMPVDAGAPSTDAQ